MDKDKNHVPTYNIREIEPATDNSVNVTDSLVTQEEPTVIWDMTKKELILYSLLAVFGISLALSTIAFWSLIYFS